jgi:hypothetical protein
MAREALDYTGGKIWKVYYFLAGNPDCGFSTKLLLGYLTLA